MLLLSLLALMWTDLSAQGHSVWMDLVPMTRRLLGAEAEAQFRMTAGWSSNLEGNGWRVLAGIAASQETQDSFGTTITTRNQAIGTRVGRRWFTGNDDDPARCRPVWGADVVIDRHHISTQSSNADFSSSNTTTLHEAGISGVIGVDLRLAPRLHLIAETRLDALYSHELNVQEDNFSGRFEQRDEGWRTRLDPPLQLFLALGL